MSLTKLILKGFQAHEKTVVKFGPGVTVIVGRSDVGKSSIVRALGWVALNSPSGDAFVREGSSQAKVVLFVDGKKIIRRRGSGLNTYSLDATKYKAFGNDVPPDVSNLLNVSELNFQGQYDAPFWLSSSAGEVSRQLNKVVKLDVIDGVLSFLGKKARQISSEISVCEQRLDTAVQQRKSLRFADKLDRQLRALEADETALAQIREQLARLNAAHDLASGYAAAVYIAVAGKDGVESALLLGQAWQAARDKRAQLENLLDQAVEQQGLLTRRPPDISSLEAQWKEVKTAAVQASRLAELVYMIENNQEQAAQAIIARDVASKKYDEEAKGKRCPTCGQKIKS